MEQVMKILQAFISVFTAAFTFFTGLFGGGTVAGYKPLDEASIKLNAAIFSDAHISTDETSGQTLLKKGMKDFSKGDTIKDAIIFTGDCTDNGLSGQYQKFYSILALNCRVSKSIVAMGNHDSWQGNNSINDFISHYNSYTGSSITKTYYSEEKNGYNFIVLGTETMLQNESYLSQTQLDWVDAKLAALTASTDKPIFIINHQPLNGTNRINEAWSLGGIGAQSDALMAILKKYTTAGATLIYCSGHLHSSFDFSGVTHDGNLYFVDCPSFGKTPERGSYRTTGTGYVLEAYVGKIILRARDFVSGKFFDEVQYTIPTGEKVTEPSTETPTESPTVKPTESPTVKPTEPSSATTQPIIY